MRHNRSSILQLLGVRSPASGIAGNRFIFLGRIHLNGESNSDAWWKQIKTEKRTWYTAHRCGAETNSVVQVEVRLRASASQVGMFGPGDKDPLMHTGSEITEPKPPQPWQAMAPWTTVPDTDFNLCIPRPNTSQFRLIARQEEKRKWCTVHHCIS
jgi:hypothetical protein